MEYGEQVNIKNFPLDREVTMSGVLTADRTYFTVEDYWNVKSAAFNMSLTQSSLLYAEISTLTVYVNDKPVSSFFLREIDKERKKITVNLPAAYIKKGNNELRIEVYRRISEKPCVDDINKANWVIVHGESYIHLEFQELKAGNILSQYPYPFLKTGEDESLGKSAIVLPDNPDAEEMGAGLQVAAGLGSMAKGQEMEIGFMRYSEASPEERKNLNMIFVGKIGSLPGELSGLAGQEVLLKAQEGAAVFIRESPYNKNRKVLCVTAGQEGEMLDRAARLLQNSELIAQMQEDSCILSKGADVYMKEQSNETASSLKALGYEKGIYLKGPFRQQASVGIRLPRNRQVQPGTKISLNLRYSKNLDFTKSLVTVLVNGTPVGSKKLEAEKADGDKIEVGIPEDVKIGSYLEIMTAFDLELTDLDCAMRPEEMPWAFVASDSSLYIPTRDERAVLFENYPWPFVKDGKLNNAAVVIPDNLSEAEYKLLFKMFYFMGSELSSNKGGLNVIKDSNFTEQDRDKNILILGSPKDVKLLREVNKAQWFKYNDGFDFFLSNEKRTLLESFSRKLAAVQIFPSPYKEDRSIMTVTAPLPENMVRLEDYLSSSEYSGQLVGNASLVDSGENLINHYFISSESEKPSIAERIRAGSSPLKIFILLFIVVLFLLLLSMILYLKKYRKI